MPDALKKFPGTISAWRGWSDLEEGVHLVFYEFKDLVTANKLLHSNLMKEFIKEFNRNWEGKVDRTREVFEVKQFLNKP